MAYNWPEQDPNETLDYYIDWTPALDGDTIVSSVVSLEDAQGVTLVKQSFTETASIVWLTGGIVGKVAKVLATVVTVLGRTLQVIVFLAIAESI